MTPYQKGTLGQVGAKPGLARKVLGTPSARQAAANRDYQVADDTLSVLDDAIGGTPLGKTVGWAKPRVERGPRLRDTASSLWFRDEKRLKEGKPAAPRTNEQPQGTP
jgi:hypothetical protein